MECLVLQPKSAAPVALRAPIENFIRRAQVCLSAATRHLPRGAVVVAVSASLPRCGDGVASRAGWWLQPDVSGFDADIRALEELRARVVSVHSLSDAATREVYR
jgi:hypothetical protein